MGFISVLQILFIGLKLGHIIDWSWWLVMAPYLGSAAVITLIGAIALVGIAAGEG